MQCSVCRKSLFAALLQCMKFLNFLNNPPYVNIQTGALNAGTPAKYSRKTVKERITP